MTAPGDSEPLSGQGLAHLEDKRLRGLPALSPVGSEGWASLPPDPTGMLCSASSGPVRHPRCRLLPCVPRRPGQDSPGPAPVSRLPAWREALGSPERTEG